jgi:hypothetical protein
MVRFKVKISAIVGGLPLNFRGQCHPFLDDQNIQKRNCTVWLYFHIELDGRPLTVEVAEGIL